MMKKSPFAKFWYTLILMLISGILGAVIAKFLGNESLQKQEFILVIISIFILSIGITIYMLFRETWKIRQSVGIGVTYLERKRNEANLFSQARKIVKTARKSILVLNSHLSDSILNEGDTTKDTREREKYYDAILERVKRGVTYERLLQLEGEQNVNSLISRKIYNAHLHKMLDVKKLNPSRSIRLIKVRAKWVTTFVLIDEKYLILETNEIINPAGMSMHGIFIFEDPKKVITTQFKKFFDEAKGDQLGRITQEELPSLENFSPIIDTRTSDIGI
jgi:hypothetical protein